MAIISALVALIVLALLAAHLYTRRVIAQVEAQLPPQGRFVDVPGARLHVVEQGSGPPVVLIHGLMGNLCHFTYGMTETLSRRFRTIAVDRPGSGYSVRLPGAGADLPTQADAIVALLDTLKLERPPVVVGHSLGGALALCIAQRHPAKVAGLALLAPLTHPVGSVPKAFEGLKVRPDVLRRLIGWTLAVPVALRTMHQVLASVFGPEAAPADFTTRGGGLLGLRPSHFVAACQDLQGVGEGDGVDRQVAGYASMKLPVRVLFGRDDQILDPAVHGLALPKALPGASCELMAGGHMIPITAAPVCAEFVGRVADEVFAARRALLELSF